MVRGLAWCRSPRPLLRLQRAQTTGPLALKDAFTGAFVAKVTTDFFEAELSARSPPRLATTRRLTAAGDLSSVAEVTSGSRAPIVAGYLPAPLHKQTGRAQSFTAWPAGSGPHPRVQRPSQWYLRQFQRADMVMKSRLHEGSKKVAAPWIVPGSNELPFVGDASAPGGGL